jgi:hypothetical protein
VRRLTHAEPRGTVTVTGGVADRETKRAAQPAYY